MIAGMSLRRSSRLLVVAAALAGGSLPAIGPAAAAPPVELSISLSDGVGEVHSAMDVTYAAKVTNGGGAKVAGRLEIAVPGYVKLKKGGGGKVSKQTATWTVTVPAGKTVSRSVRAHIGDITKGEVRVTALASVFQGRSDVPLIRTADADRIAGVHDPAPAAPTPKPAANAAKDDGGVNLWLVAGLPGAAVVLIAAAWLLRRRRHAGNSSADRAVNSRARSLATPGTVEVPVGPPSCERREG
jgi:hypothetical protein